MVQQYIGYLFAGFLFAEEVECKISRRRTPKKLPEGCFAFRFFERTETKSAKNEILKGKERNHSGINYVGKEFTIEQVEKKYPDQEILLANLKGNQYVGAALCIAGNWAGLRSGDMVMAKSDFEWVDFDTFFKEK